MVVCSILGEAISALKKLHNVNNIFKVKKYSSLIFVYANKKNRGLYY
jgi:hypothetical protein